MYLENAISDIAITNDNTTGTDTITLDKHDLVRVLDQHETIIADNDHYEVNYRPSAQQWTVCTP